jgi:2-(1,2-epoxy-1,2-dihydrophenyl)acetyl-CoA isomerase
MHQEVAEALDMLEAEPGMRVLVLTGAGRGFCAGQDLADRAVAPGEHVDLGNAVEQFYNPLIRRLVALPFPVVCAVNGVAAGAGASLALAADIVIAAHSAKFIQSFANIGLIPDSGGTWVLPRVAGRAPARRRGRAPLVAAARGRPGAGPGHGADGQAHFSHPGR